MGSRIWRAYSPPGTNQATTVAVFSVQVTGGGSANPAHITSISAVGGTLVINFTGDASDPVGAFHLQNSASLGGSFADTGAASSTQYSPGVFSFTVVVPGTNQFYRIRR